MICAIFLPVRVENDAVRSVNSPPCNTLRFGEEPNSETKANRQILGKTAKKVVTDLARVY